MTTADVNGDSKPDLVVAHSSFNNVSVLLNTTAPGAMTPSFAPQHTFGVGNSPQSVTTTDVNGDGKPDLVTSNVADGTISVLMNTTAAGAASPSFAPQQTFDVGFHPVSVTAADVNGDGRPDLMVANNGGTVSVLVNTTAPGAMSPSFAPQQTFDAGFAPTSVTAVDVNGDDKPDLIVANNASRNVSVLLNTTPPGATTPNFATHVDFVVGGGSYSVTAADVNGDGRPDLMIAGLGPSTVSVLLNTTAPGATTPSFATHVDFPAGSGGTQSVTTADLNGDDKPDLVIANELGNTVSVLMNTTPAPTAAAPSFAPQQTFGVGTSPASVTTAEVNGGGMPDLVVANSASNTVSVLLNTAMPGGTPGFAPQQTFGVGSSPQSVTTTDLNGDGKPDFVTTNEGTSNVSVLLNTTAPGAMTTSFAAQQTFGVQSDPVSVAAADLNGDGKPDVTVANSGANTVSVLMNTTAPGAMTPGFAAQQSFGVQNSPFSVVAVDVNGDGKLDLAVANTGSNTVSVLMNTTVPGASSPSFAPQQAFGVGGLPSSVTAADVNGDGKSDLVAVNGTDNTVSVLVNTTSPGATNPSFAPQQGFGVGDFPQSVTTADVNGDGKPDLVVANEGAGTVSVLLNTTASGATSPSFATQQTFGVGIDSASVTATDVNGDGRPDLLVANGADGTVSVLLNTQYAVTLAPASLTGTIHYSMPVLVPLPATLDFGTQTVGDSGTSQTVTLANTGNADLGFTLAISGAAAGNYSQSNNCPVSLTLTPGSDCSVTVTFQPSAAGTRTAALTITSNAPSSPDAVALTGHGVLVPPAAYDLTLTTYENEAISGTLPASGPTGDPLSYAIATAPTHGTAVVTAATGAFTYTPDSGYSGGDSFTFTATDTVTGAVSNTATVTITVNPTPPPAQLPPVASNLDLTTYENQALAGTLPVVVMPSSDPLNFTATQPAHGTVTITDAATGAFTYTPTNDYSGPDSFTFQATDTVTGLTSNTATVNVTVKSTPPPNAVPPVAGGLKLTAYVNTAISGMLTASVTPADDPLEFRIATKSPHGTVKITDRATGAFTYTPAEDYAGPDHFSFTASDTATGLTSNVAVVSIQVKVSPHTTIKFDDGGGGVWSLFGLLSLAAFAGLAAFIRRRQSG